MYDSDYACIYMHMYMHIHIHISTYTNDATLWFEGHVQRPVPLGDFEVRQAFTPQPEVLAHPAVKMFLSHCGWGGVTET